ncbi:TolC family protein [Halosquirtibacter laminarini]|uniref:TolC family protein n=1 Tax=Halosquirtibacter laminarini TaxID=3374600 RepID=A0AC61NF03_9BACT|nr:TolC family protein [Prolixibacteraceae bacterium]
MNKHYIKLSFTLLLAFLSTLGSYGQLKQLTLDEVISLAKEHSLEAQKAVNTRDNKYWKYRNYIATTLPNLSLSGNLPDYNRSIDPVVQNDGSTAFRSRSQARSDLNLRLSQYIPITGAKISLGSGLQRIDVLEGSDEGVSYATNPISVTIEQPIFTYNAFKWNKKIEPILFDESKKEYQEKFENISFRATQYFFQLLLAQVDYTIAMTNKANNDTIYNIGKGRYNLGKIAENELLQLQLNTLSSSRDVATSKISLETARLNLNAYIGRPKGEDFELISPSNLPIFHIDPEIALEQAKENRQQYLAFKRRRIQAEQQVAEAKGRSSLNVNVIGSYGLSQSAEDIHSSYQDLQNQQRFKIGFNIPLVDWKQRKSKLLMAEAQQRLTENTITQEMQLFEQEILVLTQKIPIIYDRVKSTKIANKIAKKQYEISRQRYMVSNISITDLNLALKSKDNASSSYLRALQDFWTSYYQLRMLTMYNFEDNNPIVNSTETTM